MSCDLATSNTALDDTSHGSRIKPVWLPLSLLLGDSIPYPENTLHADCLVRGMHAAREKTTLKA